MLTTLIYTGLALATMATARPSGTGTGADDPAFKAMQAHQLAFHPLSIVQARIDPIVNPGVNTTSGHLHTIIGPDVFNSASNTSQLRAGNCTAMTIGDNLDMSAYWQPAVYHVDSKGEFSLLNVSFMAVYYNMQHTGDMVTFPDGFSMLAGNATNFNDTKGPSDGYITACDSDLNYIPRTYCEKVGYHAQFPDCHDGKPFTKETQHLHMVHSIGGVCPPGGYIKYPAIMLEFLYDAGSEADFPANPSGQPTYVFANGDALGSTGHADFMFGWQEGVLQKVIDECSNLGLGNTANCPVLKASLGSAVDKAAGQCKYSQTIPNEDIGAVKPIKAMPAVCPSTALQLPQLARLALALARL